MSKEKIKRVPQPQILRFLPLTKIIGTLPNPEITPAQRSTKTHVQQQSCELFTLRPLIPIINHRSHPPQSKDLFRATGQRQPTPQIPPLHIQRRQRNRNDTAPGPKLLFDWTRSCTLHNPSYSPFNFQTTRSHPIQKRIHPIGIEK